MPAGQDTRPGTATEICAALSEAGKVAPLGTAAVGLYTRMWNTAFTDAPHGHVMPNAEHYEVIVGSEIDDLESTARTVIGRHMSWRQLTGTTCTGRHHGATVPCRFTATRNGRAPPPRR